MANTTNRTQEQANRQARSAWRKYLTEIGITKLTDEQITEIAEGIIANADETGDYEGITAEMDEYARR